MTEDFNAINLGRIADALERLASAFEHYATPVNTLQQTPDPLERIADAADAIASLLAAPAALKATGPRLDGDAAYWVPERAKALRGGGRSSIARSAPELVDAYRRELETAGTLYTLTFYGESGWQFVVEPPAKEEAK